MRSIEPVSPSRPYAAKYAAQVSPEDPIDEHYVDFVYQPITERDGSVSGILVQGVDVTARAVADRALALDRARLDSWDERVKDHFFFAPTARITIDDFYARIHEEDRAPTRDVSSLDPQWNPL